MQLINRIEKKDAEMVCQKMWRDIFGDSEEYVSWYFEQKWQENEAFILRDDREEICSMLHLNPYKIKMQKEDLDLHYIVGVCTRPDQRKKGLMGQLIKEAFQWLYEKKEPFSYLMPAREGIYEPYDFRKIYQAQKEKVKEASCDEKKAIYRFVDYREVEEPEREKLEAVASQYLSSRFCMYARRSQDYFQQIVAEMQACHGKLLLIYEEQNLKGYLEYGAEENSVEVFEIAGEIERESVYASFMTYLKDNGKGEEFQVNVIPFEHKEGHKGHSIMARIIHFPECASLLRSKNSKEIRLKIRDSYISQNNGKWQLNVKEDGCQVIPLKESEPVEKEMDIGEFCDYFFLEKKIYLNELV